MMMIIQFVTGTFYTPTKSILTGKTKTGLVQAKRCS